MSSVSSKMERMAFVMGSKVVKRKRPSGGRKHVYPKYGMLQALADNFRPAKQGLDDPRPDPDLPFRKPERGEFNPYPKRTY